jgi:hypothetical protein
MKYGRESQMLKNHNVTTAIAVSCCPDHRRPWRQDPASSSQSQALKKMPPRSDWGWHLDEGVLDEQKIKFV